MESPSPLSPLALRHGLTTLLRDFQRAGFHATVIRSVLVDICPAETRQAPLESVVYAAVRVESVVLGAAVRLCASDRGALRLVASVHHETSNPPYRDCPPYILEVLSDAGTEPARQWRQACAARKWSYEFIFGHADGDTRSIRIVLRRQQCSIVVRDERDIQPEAFDRLLDSLTGLYPMASIPILPSERSLQRSRPT
jgi:hypothetical protein